MTISSQDCIEHRGQGLLFKPGFPSVKHKSDIYLMVKERIKTCLIYRDFMKQRM